MIAHAGERPALRLGRRAPGGARSSRARGAWCRSRADSEAMPRLILAALAALSLLVSLEAQRYGSPGGTWSTTKCVEPQGSHSSPTIDASTYTPRIGNAYVDAVRAPVRGAFDAGSASSRSSPDRAGEARRPREAEPATVQQSVGPVSISRRVDQTNAYWLALAGKEEGPGSAKFIASMCETREGLGVGEPIIRSDRNAYSPVRGSPEWFILIHGATSCTSSPTSPMPPPPPIWPAPLGRCSLSTSSSSAFPIPTDGSCPRAAGASGGGHPDPSPAKSPPSRSLHDCG